MTIKRAEAAQPATETQDPRRVVAPAADRAVADSDPLRNWRLTGLATEPKLFSTSNPVRRFFVSYAPQEPTQDILGGVEAEIWIRLDGGREELVASRPSASLGATGKLLVLYPTSSPRPGFDSQYVVKLKRGSWEKASRFPISVEQLEVSRSSSEGFGGDIFGWEVDWLETSPSPFRVGDTISRLAVHFKPRSPASVNPFINVDLAQIYYGGKLVAGTRNAQMDQSGAIVLPTNVRLRLPVSRFVVELRDGNVSVRRTFRVVPTQFTVADR